MAPHGAAQAGLTGKLTGVPNFAMKRKWNARRSALLLPRIGGKVLSETDLLLAGSRMNYVNERVRFSGRDPGERQFEAEC